MKKFFINKNVPEYRKKFFTPNDIVARLYADKGAVVVSVKHFPNTLEGIIAIEMPNGYGWIHEPSATLVRQGNGLYYKHVDITVPSYHEVAKRVSKNIVSVLGTKVTVRGYADEFLTKLNEALEFSRGQLLAAVTGWSELPKGDEE